MIRIDYLFISLHWETALTSPTATSLFFSHPEPQPETSSAQTHKCMYAYVCVCVCRRVNSVFVQTQSCVIHMLRSGGRLMMLIWVHCKASHTVATVSAANAR